MTCLLKFKDYFPSGCFHSWSHRCKIFGKKLKQHLLSAPILQREKRILLEPLMPCSQSFGHTVIVHLFQRSGLSHMKFRKNGLLCCCLQLCTTPVFQPSSQSHYIIALGVVSGGCTVLPVSCIHWPFVCKLFLVFNWGNYSLHLANLSSFHHLSWQMI